MKGSDVKVVVSVWKFRTEIVGDCFIDPIRVWLWKQAYILALRMTIVYK